MRVARPDLGISALEALSLGLVLLAVHLTAGYRYLLFHSLVEMFSVCIAIAVSLITINCWSAIRDQYVRFVGAAYLFIGVLDVLHALSYKGMPIFTDYDYYAPQFWLAARYLEAGAMLAGFWFVATGRRPPFAPLLVGYLAVTVGFIAAILVFRVFPVCFVPGSGLTPFKIVSEYAICVMLLASLVLLYRHRQAFDARVFQLLGASLFLMVATELCFTLYVADSMNDAINEIGHLLKILAYYAVYKALVVMALRDPISVMFRELGRKQDQLLETQQMAGISSWQWLPAEDHWVWTPEMFAFFGIAPTTEPTRALLRQALGSGEEQAMADALEACRRTGAPFDRMLRVHRADGSLGHAQMRGRSQLDGHGRVLRVAGMFQDVTQAQRGMQFAELAREKRKFELLLQTSGDGIHVLDPEGRLVLANDQFCAMLGYSRDEIVGLHVEQWDARYAAPQLRAMIDDIRQGERVFETRHRRKDGSVFDVEISSKFVDLDGQALIWNASRDITERKRIAERLALAAGVFTHASEGILITDDTGVILDVNAAFCRVTGYSAAEVCGKNAALLRSGRQGEDFYNERWRTLQARGQWKGELWNRRKNGELYLEDLTIIAVEDGSDGKRTYLGMLTDITQIKEHESSLLRMAHYDALTGLPNRVLAADRLKQSMMQAQRRGNLVAVAFVDLDGFKAVNDSYGHDVGDQCLIAVGAAMRSALRDGDTLARLGGDEFLAVLVDLDGQADCEPILQRFVDAVSTPMTVGGHFVQISASVGVALFPQDGGSEPDQLIRRADQAMYAAKQTGKNCVQFFDVQQDVAVRAQREGVERIRSAMQRGEFLLHYQPKVNMRTGQVVGAEALLRWADPQRGLRVPGDFLGFIDGHAVSIELGSWVIEAALDQVGLWLGQGLDIPVSVNVGATELLSPDFTERLEQALARHPQVSPGHLEIEILETSALENLARVSEIMRVCAQMGVCFALDDFGTGYSALSYLKHLPVNQIKIDQGFVRDILTDPADRALVKGVVGLAEAFGRSVIAEGVESVAQGALLLSFGCELAQGYGIARPMPAADMPAWIAQWRPDPSWRGATAPG